MAGSPFGRVKEPAAPTGSFDAAPIKVPLADVVGVAAALVVVVLALNALVFDDPDEPSIRPMPAAAPAKTTLPAATLEAMTTLRRSKVPMGDGAVSSISVPRSTGQRSGPQAVPLR